MRRSLGRAHESHRKDSRRAATVRHPNLERLEVRNLMTASLGSSGDDFLLLSGHGGVCNCPVCSGQGLDRIPAISGDSGGPAASNPLASLPQLSSNPGATAKLYLDFNGHFQASWGTWSNATTPVYDQDGDATTFNGGELSSISEIWARVAEDYAPFHIDVTTIDPGSLANGVVAHIAIGGNWSDWYGSAAGGVAYIGGFWSASPNTGYVFEEALGNGNAKYVAEAASHEAGHLFGLGHQALWSGSTLVEPYSSGSNGWAPIMGVGYNQERTTWHNGPTASGPTTFQEDLTVLSGASNGFGWRSDDFGNATGTASVLPISGTSVSFGGLVGNNDQDVWSFTTIGGALNFQLNVATYGPNLDAVLELLDAAGNAVVTASPAGSLGATIATTVGAGTFYLVARSSGGYGNMGQYTITGTLPAAGSNPEIAVQVSGSNVADGGTLNFGSTNVGTSVSRTFTVTNTGNAALTLTALNPASMPAGFTLLTNLGSTSLAAGASTTFVVRFDAALAGTFGGSISLVNNDGDENPYDITLSAVANAAPVPAPEITVLLGATNLASGQTVSFGATNVGTAVLRTITVRNDGNATLTLTSINPASLPAGFTLVSNLGSTSLAAGQTTTFVVRLDADSQGAPSGNLQLSNSDDDESTFTLQLAGTVNAAPATVTRIVDNGASGSTFTSGWTRRTNGGLEGDYHNASKGTGSKQATWTFTGLPSGNFNVWGTWTGGSKNASNARFSFYNGTGTLPTKTVNQRVAPGGPSVDGAKWVFLGTVSSVNGWIQVRLTNKANGTVVADAIRIVQQTPAPASPEMSVQAGSIPVADGGTVTFGPTSVGTAVERTFTVSNTGTQTLTLSAINPASLPAGFTLVSNLGSTSLAPEATTTFTVRLDADSIGQFDGSIAIANNAGDPFTLEMSGTVSAVSSLVTQIIDDGGTGNTLTAGWTHKAGSGFESDTHTAAKGTGSQQAHWTFTSLPSGDYNVWGTWTAASSNATSAVFSFYNGTGPLPTKTVNQRIAPASPTMDGAKWVFLGTISVASGWMQVRLSNKANGTVVADAIRIVQQPPAAPTAAQLLVQAGSDDHSGAAAILASLASSAGYANHPDALPLPTWEGEAPAEPTAAHQPTSCSYQAGHEHVWSHPEDVAPEQALLEETLSLLSQGRSAVGEDLAALDDLLSHAALLS
jgi:hypothetical protein